MSLSRKALWALLPVCVSVAVSCAQHVIGESSGGTTSGAGGSGAGVGGATITSAASSSGATTHDAGPDVVALDSGMPSTIYPAFAIDPPQVQDYTGPVLMAPRLVPVFFADYDPMQAMTLVDLENKIGTSMFWSALAEYGVGPGMTLPPVMLTEMSPGNIDDSAIATWLSGKLNANDPAWPANDGNTVYILHYPSSNNITLQGQTSCNSFEGYHSNTQLDANHMSLDAAYAVIPDCQIGLDSLTTTISHELAEAASDPYPMGAPAYAQTDGYHAEWMRLGGGGEIGDMCVGFNSSYTMLPDLPYAVQRFWGDKASKAGHDFCQPSLPGEVFFNAMPVFKDHVTWTWQLTMQSFTVKGVKLAVGQSKTIDVALYSDGPTSGPWTVNPIDTTGFGGKTSYLDLKLDNDTGQNGQVLHLTITVNKAGPHGYESFLLHSTLGSLGHEWLGIVAPK
jgi:hypothetical protein